MAKIVVSPGQAFLLLIDNYKDNAKKSNELTRLYLCGATRKTDDKKIKQWLTDKVLAPYKVSFAKRIITNDPTRRYFETHLAYETLKENMQRIDNQELQKHFYHLQQMLPTKERTQIAHVLNGTLHEDDSTFFKEYTSYIGKISTGILFKQLSPPDREKIEIIVKNAFLGSIICQHMLAEKLNDTPSLPLLTDIVRSDETYLKPFVETTFRNGAIWVNQQHKKTATPITHSLYETMLCQLRCMAKLKKDGTAIFTSSVEKMTVYCQLMLAVMLFANGGRNLHQLNVLLKDSYVQQEFNYLSDLDALYRTDNQRAFDKALENTLDYNKIMMLRQNVQMQITGELPLKTANPALEKLQFQRDKARLIHKLSAKQTQHDETHAKIDKNALINPQLKAVKKCIQSGDLAKAVQEIGNLKLKLMQRFGKDNVWGYPSESYKLIDSLQKEIIVLHKQTMGMELAKNKAAALRNVFDAPPQHLQGDSDMNIN